MADQPAIIAEGLRKRFGDVQALDGVDLHVPAGRVLGLLGPNGAGKTTMVRILSTLLPLDAGRASVAGFDVVRQASRVRQAIGLSGQYAAVDGYLTGSENLHMIGRLSGLSRRAARRRADELVALFDLTGAAGRTVRTYSGGLCRRLDVAASLVARPAVLFLDEPTTGLDPRGRIGLWQLLADLVNEGSTLLVTTQYMEEADRLADQIVVIDAGRVIATGTADQLKARIGGDRLEVQALPKDDPMPLAAALAGLGDEPPRVDSVTGSVVVRVSNGANVLPEVATRLAQADLRVADLALRRPSLDDVFLALTGQAPASMSASADHFAEDGMTSAGTSSELVRMSGPGWLVSNVLTMTDRNLRRLVRVPTLIAFAVVQPILFVLLFNYAWGGAIQPPGVDRYIDYALPGIWVLSIGFGASQTGVAIADDLTTGMIDRFRALPMSRSALLAGRTIADAIQICSCSA